MCARNGEVHIVKIDAYNLAFIEPDAGRRKSYYTSVKVITYLRNGAVLGNVRAPRRVANARRSSSTLSDRNERVVYRITLCRWISLPLARFSLDLALFAIAALPSFFPARLPCFKGNRILFQVLLCTWCKFHIYDFIFKWFVEKYQCL